MAGIWGRAKGALEAGATLASGAVAEPVAGWAGILNGGDAGAVQRTRQALTYAPKTPEGQQAVAGIGDILGKLKDAAMKTPIGSAVNGFNAVADKAGEASPVLGAAVKTAPAALAMLFGPGGTATRSAVGNVAKGTAQGIERAAITAADNAAAIPAMRGPMAHEKGIFAGHLSKEAPIWKLEQAKTMQALGKDDREIYAHTGWFAGSADGKWRYEIPDNEARWNFEQGDKPITELRKLINDPDRFMPVTQEKVMHHPALYEAYPDAKDIEVGSQASPMFGSGSFERQPGAWGKVSIDGPANNLGEIPLGEARNNYLDTNLHELQHAIQQREGFAQGGNSGMFKDRDMTKELSEPLDAEIMGLLNNNPEFGNLKRLQNREFVRISGLYGKTDEQGRSRLNWDDVPEAETAAYFDLLDKLTKFDEYWRYSDLESQRKRIHDERPTFSADEQYHRLAGEAEARLVQKRMAMSPEERAASYPPDMYDVPVQDQLVRYR